MEVKTLELNTSTGTFVVLNTFSTLNTTETLRQYSDMDELLSLLILSKCLKSLTFRVDCSKLVNLVVERNNFRWTNEGEVKLWQFVNYLDVG